MYFRHLSKHIIIHSQILQKLYLHYSNRPTEAVIGTTSGPGPHCPRCLRTVYDAERAIGLNDVRTQITQFGYSYILEREGGVQGSNNKDCKGMDSPPTHPILDFHFLKFWLICFAQLFLPNFF